MKKATWLRCCFVSICFATFVPLAATTVLVPIGSGPTTSDLPLIGLGDLNGLDSVRDPNLEIVQVPTRRLTGFERFTYPFSHPQLRYFYLRSFALLFVCFFVGTVIVAYGVEKQQRDLQSS